MEHASAPGVMEASDGRFVHVLNRPIASGDWVATHEDVTERWRSEARIAHMARHDARTDLPNRLLFMEKMSEALTQLMVSSTQFSLFVFDLDLFKTVNDSLGHPIGELLLKSVASRLGELVSEFDTVGRLGGDEFAILRVGNQDARDEAAALANRLFETVGAPDETEGPSGGDRDPYGYRGRVRRWRRVERCSSTPTRALPREIGRTHLLPFR